MSCGVMGLKFGSMFRKVDAESFSSHIYHEKQVKELCAMHALNNLLQEKEAFTQKKLDQFCHELTPTSFFNPHKSLFGTGNYDVNVIMYALKSRGYETIWFDKRNTGKLDEMDFSKIKGFILNTPSDYKLAGISLLRLGRKHWIALREIDGTYYNLDSKLKEAKEIGCSDDLRAYLKIQLSNDDNELLFVVTEDVHKNSTWKQNVESRHESDGQCHSPPSEDS